MFLDAENTLKEHINDHIFYLEEPTGAGKSNTALNLSFQIIKKVKKKSIQYLKVEDLY